jgi:hypothetical protein
MANVPFPIQGQTLEEVRYQIYELIRTLYEEKIGGADLGDVFSLIGDVLTLELASSSGLTKEGNDLAVDPLSTGGLQVTTDGAAIKIVATGGLETDSSGAGVKLDGTSLTVGASGLRVNVDLIDWPNLTASRLLATDASESLTSVANLAAWIAGTADHIDVSNDGDGSVTLDISSTTLDRITALEAADAQFEGQVFYSGGP